MSGHSTYQPQSAFMRWMERRLPIGGLVYSSLVVYPTPRNLNYWWTFGGILSFMLAVQIHEGAPQLPDERGGARRTIHPGATPSFSRHFAPQDEQPVIGFNALFGEQLEHRFALGDVEDSLHRRLRRTRTDALHGRPVPEQQSERAHNDGLARTRLTGERVQPGLAMNGEGFDDGEVGNAKL